MSFLGTCCSILPDGLRSCRRDVHPPLTMLGHGVSGVSQTPVVHGKAYGRYQLS